MADQSVQRDDPASLVARDPDAGAAWEAADPRVAVLLRSQPHLLRDAEPGGRARLLALEAARYGWPDLASAFGSAAPDSRWSPVWATGERVDARQVQARGTEGVHSRAPLALLDGRLAVVHIDNFGGVRTCDALDGTEISRFAAGARAHPVAVVHHADSTLLLTGQEGQGPDGLPDAHKYGETVRAWNLRDGTPVGQPLTVPEGRIVAAAPVPGTGTGRTLLVTGGWDGLIRVWDLLTGRETAPPTAGHLGWITAVATATVTGRAVAVTAAQDDPDLLLWDLADAGRAEPRRLRGHTAAVLAVAATDFDGIPVAVSGSEDGTVRVWDLSSGRQLGDPLTGHGHRVGAVTTARMGGRTLVATGSWDDTVRLWDLATRQPVGDAFTGPEQPVEQVVLASVGGTPLVAAREFSGLLRVWRRDERRRGGAALPRPGGPVAQLAAVTVAGRDTAVSGDRDGGVTVFETGDPHSARLLTRHHGYVSALTTATVADRPLVLSAGADDGLVRLTALDDGDEYADPLDFSDDPPCALAADDSAGLLVLGRSGTVRVWDLAARREVGEPLATPGRPIRGLACAGGVLVTGHADHTVALWDLSARQPLAGPLPGHRRAVDGVATAVVDGRPVAVTSANFDGRVRMWDLVTGRQLGEPLVAHRRRIGALATTVSVDGTPIALTGSDDGTVRAWNLRTHEPFGPPLPFPYRVTALTPTPDGGLLVAFGEETALLAPRR